VEAVLLMRVVQRVELLRALRAASTLSRCFLLQLGSSLRCSLLVALALALCTHFLREVAGVVMAGGMEQGLYTSADAASVSVNGSNLHDSSATSFSVVRAQRRRVLEQAMSPPMCRGCCTALVAGEEVGLLEDGLGVLVGLLAREMAAAGVAGVVGIPLHTQCCLRGAWVVTVMAVVQRVELLRALQAASTLCRCFLLQAGGSFRCSLLVALALALCTHFLRETVGVVMAMASGGIEHGLYASADAASLSVTGSSMHDSSATSFCVRAHRRRVLEQEMAPHERPTCCCCTASLVAAGEEVGLLLLDDGLMGVVVGLLARSVAVAGVAGVVGMLLLPLHTHCCL
jgi:hypothetical protein